MFLTSVRVSDTIYEGARFRLTLKFSEDYPSSPPSVRFISKIYHPNVYGDGDICLNVLQQEWSPALGVKSLLLTLQQLLNEPNADDPTNAVAAEEYKNDYETYCENVRKAIAENQEYAGGSSGSN